MAYGSNPFQRIDRLETIICEQQAACIEQGIEAEREGDFNMSDWLYNRCYELDLRLERLAHISAKYSAETLI